MKKLWYVGLMVVMCLISCLKNDDISFEARVDGQLLIHGTDKPGVFPYGGRPMVELYELVYGKTGDLLTPTPTWERPIDSAMVDGNGKFHLSGVFKSGGVYYVRVKDYDTIVYRSALKKRLTLQYEQTVFPEMIARAWVTPRFVNVTNHPGDSFFYWDGIGSKEYHPAFVGSVDTVMNWLYETWGGPEVSAYNQHKVGGRLYRLGRVVDTIIYYVVPPYDTTVVTIAW